MDSLKKLGLIHVCLKREKNRKKMRERERERERERRESTGARSQINEARHKVCPIRLSKITKMPHNSFFIT